MTSITVYVVFEKSPTSYEQREMSAVVSATAALNLKPFIIFVSVKKFNWKIEECNHNQEQRGR